MRKLVRQVLRNKAYKNNVPFRALWKQYQNKRRKENA